VPSSVDIETLPAAVSPPAARPKVVHGKVAFIDGFDRGVEAAVQQGKPMLVFFTAEWCHYCHQMAAEAFADSNVATLSERFVCILVDADAEPRVCRRFRVKSFPTVQFLSSRRTPLNRLVGKRSTADLLRQMHAALQAVARSDERESSAKR
jgi:thioredoxin-like negative regulator of GroEL